MTRARALLMFGVWVAILPYLGFPYFWKNLLFTITGLLLVYFGYILHRESRKGSDKKTFDNFSENHHFDSHKKRSTDE